MTVAQKLRRKRNMTITTSATESTSVNCTSLTEARMVAVRSETTLILMSDGIEACRTGSIFWMRSTVWTTLARAARGSGLMMVAVPLNRPRRGVEQLVVGGERVALARAVEGAFRQVDIRLADDAADILEADAA